MPASTAPGTTGSRYWARRLRIPPFVCQDSTDPSDCPESREHRAWKDPVDNIDIADPSEPRDAKDPADPMDITDPVDPIDSTDSDEQMLRMLLRERQDQRAGMDRSCRAIRAMWQTDRVQQHVIIIS